MNMYLGGVLVSSGLVVGGLSFILNHGHFLNSLLSLEFLGVAIYWGLSMGAVKMSCDLFFVIFFLVMLVSEGVLGLSILISGSYSHGSDYMSSYNSVVC
nr:TPA_asm: ND4L [Echinogammarus berilloni]